MCPEFLTVKPQILWTAPTYLAHLLCVTEGEPYGVDIYGRHSEVDAISNVARDLRQ